ncbi:MAG TPA: molybdopterin-dependent oxidoreductase [Solirubrobacteraceae bacterium]|nr:molybdopterin-dependent oxidoreductase [Solirubrobacteraceae bacterium]
MTATAHITCPLCEATCGLEVTLDGGEVTRVRGDAEDVFSKGFLCPKGGSLGALHHDPDRLRTPLVRRDGKLEPATWDEAFEEIDRRLSPIIEQHGRDAVGVYLGNPSAHNLSAQLYNRVLLKSIGTRNVFSASSVDQMPKHLSAGHMFGGALSIPVPDLDRTMHLLVLGANPLASNGSLMTAPDARGRLRAIRERGGKIVVVDPRRSRTAEHADEHHFIRPGTDAFLLFAIVHVLFAEGLTEPVDHLDGLEEVERLAEPFTPEAAAEATSIPAEEIRRMARELAAAPKAAVYGRIGTTTAAFGTLASWLVDVINAITGNLDREGGAMFPLAAAGQANSGPAKPRRFAHARWTSRVRGLPEALGELPTATLADEIETPGEGQIRALFTLAGNPCVSTPNATRLAKAIGQLDLFVALDVYVNETTSRADVVLPGPTPLERPHYDLALYQLAVRNVANWTPAILDGDVPQEWQTMLRLAAVAAGQGPHADVAAFDDLVAAEVARGAGLDPAVAGERTGPERLMDLLLRAGPYELTLANLEAAPHGIDLGPLKPRLPEVLRTPSGRVELAPEAIVADVPRLREALGKAAPNGNGGFVLIGRRQLRSNNSWMHNLTPLVKGKDRCTAWLNPADAERLNVADGASVSVRSRTGAVEIPVEVTPDIMPGVVSIPHGWGHDVDGARLTVAAAHPGVNSNILADEMLVDPLSGNAVFNGIPVEVASAG